MGEPFEVAEDERGAVLLLTTLALLFIVIPMVGLAIDGGTLYAVKAKLQTATDGAALAAARSLSRGLSLSSQQSSARAMAERCRELLAERVEVVTEPAQSTLVAFRPPGDAAEAVERLAERGVVVREMPGLGWVRASVGFWTSEEDLERLVEAL